MVVQVQLWASADTQPLYQHTFMYSTHGIEAVATITELRSNTSELVDHARDNKRGILIQKNNKPYAVLIAHDFYVELLELKEQQDKKK